MALIDIGSSSVRLVIYSDHCRAARVLFNEKHTCDLAEDLEVSGGLLPDTIQRAIAAIRRFATVVQHREIPWTDVHLFATSAVRDANNAATFINEVQQILPATLKVLSGDDEARLSAYGVAYNHPEAVGVVGDLGGGSLELAEIDVIDADPLGQSLSLPFGAVRFKTLLQQDPATLQKRVAAGLADVPWISAHSTERFYAVGGSWRNLGLLHLSMSSYPLAIIGGYRVARTELRDFLAQVQVMPVAKIEGCRGISRKRAAMLPFAAMLLEAVLQRGQFAEVEFSAMSLRDGCFYVRLPDSEQQVDPLIRGCSCYLSPSYQHAEAEALYRFSKPIAQAIPTVSPRIHKALCLLGNIAQSDHPEFRVEHALIRVLHLAAPMLSHQDRAWLAVAVASRYGRIPDRLMTTKTVRFLLSESDYSSAGALGRVLRLGHSLSGGATNLLALCRLSWDHARVTLDVPRDIAYLLSERVERRRTQLERSMLLTQCPTK